MTSTRDALANLLVALQAERTRPRTQRATGASDESLDGAVDRVTRAGDRLRGGDRVGAVRLLDELAHEVVDSWAYAPPANDVVACAQALRSLR
ncbi:hypothetical protein [Nocardioides sp. AX2bis]|uniref:hypothetical protein n=1 Tax=Nocardioides sp. AX2bis TaxID=2653157 RepID=UPI0012F33C66|nr:hypothetical protein [Nocardioides sp. AX2bis]VXC23872.1 hypothetical protein NOCARDAX2BIS_490003 [Nocardioides sp. AX2bis]